MNLSDMTSPERNHLDTTRVLLFGRRVAQGELDLVALRQKLIHADLVGLFNALDGGKGTVTGADLQAPIPPTKPLLQTVSPH